MTVRSHDALLDPAAYHALLRRSTELIWLLNADRTLRYVSPSYSRVLGRAPSDVVGQDIVDLIHPEDRDAVKDVFQRSRERENVTLSLQFRSRHADESWHIIDAFITNLLDDPAVLGFVVNGRDVAERVLAQQGPASETEYRNVFEATLESLVINDMAGRIVETNSAARALYGYTDREMIGRPLAMLIHPDWRERMASQLQGIADGPVQFEGLIVRKDRSVRHIEGRAIVFVYRGGPHILSMARDVTERVKAYELLEQRVKERTRELSTLLDVSRNVASTLELQPLLDLILDQLKTVVDYTGAGITIQEGDEVRIVGYAGPGPQTIALGSRMPVSRAGPLWHLMRKHEPVIIEDVRSDTPDAQTYRDTVGELLYTDFSYVRSWMTVPMRFKDRDVGALFLEHREPGAYTSHHADLALAIARQAAIAMENAHLYEQAQELATVEERARLARELHDSVTQALFSMTLHARTAQMLLEREGVDLHQPLSEVIQRISSLTQGALAEMRALIFELRPGALREEGLVAALRKHAAALGAREALTIEVEAPPGRLPFTDTVEEHLYRLAQEALHNVIKHASARRAWVRIRLAGSDTDVLLMEIQDDGVGFDATAEHPGHMGLRTMADRTQRMRGRLEITSAPGQGTTVRVTVRDAFRTSLSAHP